MSLLDSIRPMTEGDLPAVLKIESQSYEFPWSRKGFENALDQGLNYVFCSVDDQILGYVCFLTVLDEVQLLNLCIAPGFQGKGIAARVLSQLAEKLLSSGYRVMFLEVRESNRSARKLYQKLGFKEDGIRKNYYQAWTERDGEKVLGKEDAVLMSKPL